MQEATPPKIRPAAQYLRMSTERQDFSIETQGAVNSAYAEAHGLTIVQSYTDAGLSGLSIERREGLKSLLADVLSGAATYSVVLVHDVSRWGRFQNPDQAAHYEFMCAEAGIPVVYCAESFANDGSPTASLLKHIKRAMAAEYSRELSQKVSQAQRGLLAQGYWMGGQAPFALRRQVEDEHGRPALTPDEALWKKKQGIHGRLVWGAPDEVELVRRIFRMYLSPRATIASVARQLRKTAGRSHKGSEWSGMAVARILENETYIGRFVTNKYWHDVGSEKRTALPKDAWITIEDVVPAIISKETFAAAVRKRARLRRFVTRTEAIADLKRLASEHGDLNMKILNRFGRWSRYVYARRVGTIPEIREQIGLPPSKYTYLLEPMRLANEARWAASQIYSDSELLDALKAVLVAHGRINTKVLLTTPGAPKPNTLIRRFGGMAEAYRLIGYKPDFAQLRAMQICVTRAANSNR